MGSNRAMKKKFLTLYDYGSGGVWTYIYATSAQAISEKYPRLTIIEHEPEWFTDEDKKITKSYDINDEPDPFLSRMAKP
jgi:hypothetical protein